MESKITKRWMKVAGLSLALTAVATVTNAQTADGSTAIAKGTTGALTATTKQNYAVRVVDNRGTVKYLQSNNGITTVSNVDASGNAVTTWQLGGAFTDDTKLDFNGKVFSFDNVTAVDLTKTDGSQAAASVNETSVTTATTNNSKGWAILVRDVATGAVKQLLSSDLVKGGSTTARLSAATLPTGFTAWTAGSALVFTDSSLPTDITKISVFRNGVKMIGSSADAGTPDYSAAGSAGAVSLTLRASNGSDANGDDYQLTASDRIEIQWIK